MKRFAIAAAVLLALPCSAAAKTRAFTIEDALAIREVSSPRISPDGAWIAYVETRNDLDADEKKSQIFIVSRDGGETVKMTADTYSASDPRWSPDGKYLSFIAARTDLDEGAAAQVWTLNLKGGEAERYTNVPQGVEGHEWSRDGARMLLVIRDESEAAREARLAREKGEEEKAQPFVIDRRQFKEDGVGYLDRSRAHLYLIDKRAGDPTQITFGDYEDMEPAWRPDGAEIIFVSNRTIEPDANDNTDLWIVPADPKAKRREPRRLTTNEGPDRAPSWSADGSRIAYVSAVEPKLLWYASNHLAVIESAGGNPLLVTKALDRNVDAPRFSPSGEAVLVTVEDDAERHPDELRHYKDGPLQGGDLRCERGRLCRQLRSRHLSARVGTRTRSSLGSAGDMGEADALL